VLAAKLKARCPVEAIVVDLAKKCCIFLEIVSLVIKTLLKDPRPRSKPCT